MKKGVWHLAISGCHTLKEENYYEGKTIYSLF